MRSPIQTALVLFALLIAAALTVQAGYLPRQADAAATRRRPRAFTRNNIPKHPLDAQQKNAVKPKKTVYPNFDPAAVAAKNPCTGNACTTTLSFAGKAAKAFEVSQHLPQIPFTLPTTWAGTLPISSSTSKLFKTGGELFFWLWGSETPTDTLTIWINGGPGCSSLLGALTENGHLQYKDNVTGPYRNPKRWSQTTSVLYVDQPVGVGLGVGPALDRNELDAAKNFGGFLDNFFNTFPELKGKKLYFTGESYAGLYLQYMADYEYKRGNPHNLQGTMIIDGVVGVNSDLDFGESLTANDYAVYWKDLLELNSTDLADIKARSDKCDLTNYSAKYLRYPLAAPLPAFSQDCDVLGLLWNKAQAHYSDPDAFDLYNINDRTLGPPSILSDLPDGGSSWLSRADVKKALHTAHKGEYSSCSDVFTHYQDVPKKSQPNITTLIERSPKWIWAHGMYDMRLLTNGTKLFIQNQTWRGEHGFQSPPTARLIDTDGKDAGSFQTERGVSLVVVDRAGHMIPGDTPAAGLRLLRFLLGLDALDQK
ncbi:hypothetical protein V8E36_004826 [Tilletia maclaganii]